MISTFTRPKLGTTPPLFRVTPSIISERTKMTNFLSKQQKFTQIVTAENVEKNVVVKNKGGTALN